MGEQNLQIRRGDNRTFTGYIKDEDGVAVDITGYTIKFSVSKITENLFKNNVTVEEADYEIRKTTADATEVDITSPQTGDTKGQYKVYLLPADTQEKDVEIYGYDVEVTTTDSPVKAYTTDFGEFFILGDIGRPAA